MKIINYLYLVVLIAFMSCHDQGKEQTAPLKNNLQVRQYPLVTIDSNISAWSATSKLYNSQLKHPDGSVLPLVGLIRIDGNIYRFMGIGELPDKAIAGMSADSDWQGKYTFVAPDHAWTKRDFDDCDWSIGRAPFGTKRFYSVNTIWPSSKIWVRRKIVINQDDILNQDLYFKYSHDDVFEVCINDILLVKTAFEWRQNEVVKIPDKIKETIKDGEIVIAAHCKNLSGGALVDLVFTRGVLMITRSGPENILVFNHRKAGSKNILTIRIGNQEKHLLALLPTIV